MNTSTRPDGGHPGEVYWCNPGRDAGDFLVVPHYFYARENGSFGIKITKNLDSGEFVSILTAVCAAFEVDCSEAAAGIRAGAHYVNGQIATGNLQTSAFIDYGPNRTAGEEYYGKFVAPDGFTTCKAKIDAGNGGISGEASFSGTIQRMDGPNGDGLGLYAVVPKQRPQGQWVAFNVYVEYVRKDRIGRYDCWPDNTIAFSYKKGFQNGYSFFPGARF